MNMKKQLALGGALLTATAAACLKLAQWAGKKIESRQKKNNNPTARGRGRSLSLLLQFLRRNPSTSSADTL